MTEKFKLQDNIEIEWQNNYDLEYVYEKITWTH